MAYQEEEQSRLRRLNTRDAINLALQGKWREAIGINKTIVESFPNDLEAYNRLGRAHMEMGEYNDAEAAYRRALAIDTYNSIAQKNLQRLALLKKSKVKQTGVATKIQPQAFVEEIGKAGVVSLLNLAKPEVLAPMVAGDLVLLKIDGNNLQVTTEKGKLLGTVEPRHGQRLVRLMKGGNKYSAAVVSSATKSMTVIIRETYQAPGMIGHLSFATRGIEGVRTDITDRAIRREIEQEEALLGDAGYTVVGGGEEQGLLAEEPPQDEYDDDQES